MTHHLKGTSLREDVFWLHSNLQFSLVPTYFRTEARGMETVGQLIRGWWSSCPGVHVKGLFLSANSTTLSSHTIEPENDNSAARGQWRNPEGPYIEANTQLCPTSCLPLNQTRIILFCFVLLIETGFFCVILSLLDLICR